MASFAVKSLHRVINEIFVQIELNYTNVDLHFNETLVGPECKTDLATFNIRCQCVAISCRNSGSRYSIPKASMSIKFEKKDDLDLIYTVSVENKEIGIFERKFTAAEVWHVIHETNLRTTTLNIVVRVDIAPNPSPFAVLHDDTSLSDFELRGVDGAVRMHRVVLASVSPVFKAMFDGPWVEQKEGYVDMPAYTKSVLQSFKDYVYKKELKEDTEKLLLIASYAMMPDLELKCVYKLIEDLKAENTCQLMTFAANNQMTKLMLAIFECVKHGVVNIDEISKYAFLNNKNNIKKTEEEVDTKESA